MAPSKPTSHKTNHLNDVFVIGAGASRPYGFPTGAHLLQSLRGEQLYYAQPDTEDILASLGFTRAKLRFQTGEEASRDWHCSDHGALCAKWSRLVRGSVILTIDQFLKNIEDHKAREFGKRLMARQILKAEEHACKEPKASKSESLFGSMHAIDWIQEFLTRVDLFENWKEYLSTSVFLTFNYDRVLEFFLERYLVVDKNWQPQEARRFIEEEMSIHHMNGHIGSLDQVPFGNLAGKSPEYDPLFDPKPTSMPQIDWTSVSNRMRTVWEDPEHHPDAAEIQKSAKLATSEAERVFVIGTSFIPENFEAIGLDATRPSPSKNWDNTGLYCTTFQMSEAQVDRAASLLGDNGRVRKEACFFNKTARDFVVDHVVL